MRYNTIFLSLYILYVPHITYKYFALHYTLLCYIILPIQCHDENEALAFSVRVGHHIICSCTLLRNNKLSLIVISSYSYVLLSAGSRVWYSYDSFMRYRLLNCCQTFPSMSKCWKLYTPMTRVCSFLYILDIPYRFVQFQTLYNFNSRDRYVANNKN